MPKLPKDTRIQSILEAAMLEFLEKGYYHTTVEKIAARAGVTKGGLYHHFRSKDEILLEANKKFGEPVAGMLQELAQSADVRAGLKAFIAAYLTHWAAHPKKLYFFSLSMTKTMELPELARYHAQATEDQIAFFEQMYQRGVATGTFRPLEPRTHALALLSALNGSLAYISMTNQIPAAEIIGRFHALFVDAFRPQ